MTYLDAAQKIFDWLSSLQVKDRFLRAHLIDHQLCFDLNHPVFGLSDVRIVPPEEDRFVHDGIAFCVLSREGSRWELEVYDCGGIFDPVEGRVVGDHYATSHFAWLGAMLYQRSQSPETLEKIKTAIDFHVRTSPDEYLFQDEYYHWDFQNIAFLQVYSRLASRLDPATRKLWKKKIKRLRESTNNPLTNWLCMRTFNALLRMQLFWNPKYTIQYHWLLENVRWTKDKDGCFEDEPGKSRSVQYHLYTVALLHRMYRLKRNKALLKEFLEGLNYFIQFIDPDGSYQYIGRGQEQIFGYGLAIYVLEAAIIEDPWNAAIYQTHLDTVWNHLLSFFQDTHFPLTLNRRKDEEGFGWFDYNYLTVYNAFLGVWLTMADDIRKEDKSVQSLPRLANKNKKVAIFRNNDLFAVFYQGTATYLSEPTITPFHLWMKGAGWIFSCPGGPYCEAFASKRRAEHIEKNMFAPLAQTQDGQWLIPAFKEADSFSVEESSIVIALDYGPFVLTRQVEINDGLFLFTDTFHFKTQERLSELRFFNLPVIIDKFRFDLGVANELRLNTMQGLVRICVLESDFPCRFFSGAEMVQTVKGLANIIVMKENHYSCDPKQEKRFQFSIECIHPE